MCRQKPPSLRPAPLLSAVSISKRYGDFLANDGIDLDLFPAEIHALLGENGAGKSTLVKVMYGLIQPSAGELRWMGQKIVLGRSIRGACARHRHGVPAFLAVREPHRSGERRARTAPTNSFAAISRAAGETARVYGLPLDPKREVWRLSVGERQRIEIVRALMQNPKLLILDEPTAVLTPQEADQLFIVLRRLREEGPRDSLHQSQARRGQTAVRYRDHSARRQESCDLRSTPGDRRIARPHDGRRRDRRGEGGVRSRRIRAAARHP